MIAAIDPGITGAIAWFDNNGRLLAIDDMPVEQVTVQRKNRSRVDPGRLTDLLAYDGLDLVVLEEVWPQARNGSVPNFGLGRSFGVTECAVIANEIQLLVVSPMKWKKALDLTGKDKKASLALARELWPDRTYFDRVKDNGRAEAALIGHWYYLENPPARQLGIEAIAPEGEK